MISQIAKNKPNFPNIFHIDMNHVSLRDDYIRTWLKQLAEIGYDTILWELEDKVCWETCPDVVWPEAMSKEQFRLLLEYSRSLGLKAIPLLQTIGHGEYVLKHEPYHVLREKPDDYSCYCTLNPEVRKLLKGLVAEYLDLFGDIEHFHLGGDEAYHFATCPACLEASKRTSRNQLYVEHLTDVGEAIVERGVRPGIWCDMILRHPEDMACIPKAWAIWDWNYYDGVTTPEQVVVWGKGHQTRDQIAEETVQQVPEILDEQGNLRAFYTVDALQRFGYDSFLCSSTRMYGDTVFCGRHHVHAPNVVGAAHRARKHNLLGQCVTSWAVRIFNLELQELWLRLGPAAVIRPELSLDELIADVGGGLLGMEASEIVEAIDNIAAPLPFIVSGLVRDCGVQWTGHKDSVPAPPDHIANSLRASLKENAEDTYASKKARLAEAAPRIAAGQATLERLATKVTPVAGKRFVAEWLRAAMFQQAIVDIAGRVFERFEARPMPADRQAATEISQLRDKYENWAREWMTPQSACLNADLIFKPILNFFTNELCV